MYPRIGGLEAIDGIWLYGPVNGIAALSVSLVLFWLMSRDGVRWTRLLPIGLVVAIGGFGGAKLYSFLYRGGIGPLEEELRSGLRYPGALVGMLLAVWIGGRLLPAGVSRRDYLDAWAPGFAVGGAIGRLACLLHGCCYGAPTGLPWAIRYPRGSIPWYDHLDAGRLAVEAAHSAPVHPFPIYLMAMEGALAAYLLWLWPRRRYPGQVLLHFLAIHGLSKGVIEAWRDPFDWLHLAVVPIGLAAVGVLAWLERDMRAEALDVSSRSPSR